MTLAMKCIHNLPPHLSYVSTLPVITQKPECNNDKLKQRLIGTWDCDHRRSRWPVANMAACMCKCKETSLRTPTV